MSSIDFLGERLRDETIGQLVQVATTALLFVVLARLLDPNTYGLVFLTIAIVHLIRSIADWGLGNSTGKYVAEYKSKDPGQIPYIVRFGTAIWITSISISAILLYLLSGVVTEIAGQPELVPYVQIGAIVLVTYAGVEFCRRVFQGFEQIRYAALVYLLEGLFRLVFVCGIVALGFKGTGALWGFAIGSALASGFGFALLYVRSYRPWLESVDETTREPGLYRRIMEYALPLTLTRGSNQIDKQIDTVIVGMLLNPVAVAYYSLAKQISTPIIRPATVIGFTIAPNAGATYADGNTADARELYQKVLGAICILYIPAAVGILLVAESAIGLLFGAEYIEAAPVFQVLALYVLLEAIAQATGQGLDYLGRAKYRAYAKGLTAIANVGLTALLVTQLGVVGAAWATVITHSAYVALNLVILHSVLSIDVRRISELIARTAAITGVMAGAVFGVTIVGDSQILVIPAVVAGLIVWAIGMQMSGIIDFRERTITT